MKKLFLLSALALCAMTMNAQIEYEGTISHVDPAFSLITTGLLSDRLYFSDGDSVLYIYDEELTLIKTVHVPASIASTHVRKVPGTSLSDFKCVSRNLFTVDGKVTFVRCNWVSNTVYVYNEDLELIANFSGQTVDEDIYSRNLQCGIVQVNGKYKFVVCTGLEGNGEYFCYYDFYSLPGNGQPTDLESPTAPARTSNARKVVENGQLYIILDGVKYAVTGTEL